MKPKNCESIEKINLADPSQGNIWFLYCHILKQLYQTIQGKYERGMIEQYYENQKYQSI